LEKLLSIVIPAKNEAIMIAKCIEGAMKALENIPNSEIILVDSYSKDDTVKIAKQYPIRILRLRETWFKSPHAGRFIGTINSHGKYIFFLDADMIVAQGFIETALDALEKDNKLAGITGTIYNVLPNEDLNRNHIIRHPIGYVEYLPGPSIYKREVLFLVNHFNPYFKGNGEREVGYRIARLGYHQIRIEKMISYHCKKEYSFDESFEKASYFIGVGQFIRAHFDKNIIIEMLKKYRRVFYFSSLALSFLILLFIMAVYEMDGIKYMPVVIVLLLLLVILKQRNLRKTFLDLSSISVRSFYFFYGLLKPVKTADSYPVDVEIVK
jgi:glycosyltransferase involved in cell wall biosynthesis